MATNLRTLLRHHSMGAPQPYRALLLAAHEEIGMLRGFVDYGSDQLHCMTEECERNDKAIVGKLAKLEKKQRVSR